MGENRFSVVQILVKEKVEEGYQKCLRTFICINENDIKIPHPISNFLRQKYENKSLEPNTVKVYAEVLKGFLNYIYASVDPKLESVKKNGIVELNADHAIMYINSLSYKYKKEELKANTVLSQMRVLSSFFIWLHKQNFIGYEAFEYSIEKINIMGRTIERIDSPISYDKLDLVLPKRDSKRTIRRRKRHDFGKGRIDLANLFIEISKEIAPEITLGIAFQIYGGLRKGEVINLLNSSFNKNKYKTNEPMVVYIKDNWDILFSYRKFDPADQVKVGRDQIILQTSYIHSIYQNHLIQLERINKKIGPSKALFRSYTNGKAIGGRSYQNKFNKVKAKFLEVLLEESKLEEYHFLTSKSWSTHIGRGIFTNILYFNLKLSHEEVALLRGDSFTFSSEHYLEESNLLDIANKCIELLSISGD
ncbi:hypothetical protein [Viridibacillus arvi]|uniref:hypothetical protein n=1 Tax=Viridibacillus arvi TaxID=263475 RepID=UPI003D0317DE